MATRKRKAPAKGKKTTQKKAADKTKPPAKPPSNKAEAGRMEREANAAIAGTAKRLQETGDQIDKVSARFKTRKGEASKKLRETVESTHDGTDKKMAAIHKRVVVQWQNCDEIEAERKVKMHPLLDDRDNLRKRMREQLANINQPNLPGVDVD